MHVLLCSASSLLPSPLSWAPYHHHPSIHLSIIYLSPFFNAKIAFGSLLDFLIPPCFEEKPKEACYSNFLIFATWKGCSRVEIQKAPAASFTAKTHSLHATLREGHLAKIMRVFSCIFVCLAKLYIQ